MRRIARHDDQEFSNQSILNSMEKFVHTVNSMNETILVPSRLMDRQVGKSFLFTYEREIRQRFRKE